MTFWNVSSLFSTFAVYTLFVSLTPTMILNPVFLLGRVDCISNLYCSSLGIVILTCVAERLYTLSTGFSLSYGETSKVK